jgi:hypothetical protein
MRRLGPLAFCLLTRPGGGGTGWDLVRVGSGTCVVGGGIFAFRVEDRHGNGRGGEGDFRGRVIEKLIRSRLDCVVSAHEG